MLWGLFSHAQYDFTSRPNTTLIKQQLEVAKSDTACIRLLITLAEGLGKEGIDSALAVSLLAKNKIHDFCKKEKCAGNDFILKSRVKNCQALASIYNIKNKVTEAENEYLQTVEIVKQSGRKEIIAEFYRNVGRFYKTNGLNEKAIEAFKEALIHYEALQSVAKQGEMYSLIADVSIFMGNTKDAESNYLKAIEYRKKANDEKALAVTYNNIANMYAQQGNISDALKYYYQSLAIRDKLKDYRGIAQVTINMTDIHLKQSDTAQAIENIRKAIILTQQNGLAAEMASAYIYNGFIFHARAKYDSALYYYSQCLSIRKKISDKSGTAYCHYNMARVYASLNNNNAATAHMDTAATIWEKIGDKKGIARSLSSLAKDYQSKKDYDNALKYALQSYKLAQEIKNTAQIQESTKLLSSIYKEKKEYDNALEMYELFVKTKDSLNSDENRNALFKSKAAYEFQLKEANLKSIQEQKTLAFEEKIKRDKLLFQFEKESQKQKLESEKQALLYEEKLKQEKIENDFKIRDEQNKLEQIKKELLFKEQKKQQNTILITVIIILIIVSGFSTLLYNRFKLTKKQNLIIEEQKNQVQEKNKEITDSITYAKRIQAAILPPERLLKKHLPRSFIYYQPKDIVAGDFYWMEAIENWTIFAAADCTGHGVPGAMVSVVCHNALNRSVKEFGLKDPGQILDKTRAIIIEEFEKSDEEVKDGMDISLCALHNDRSTMKWAGANNPLWIVRNGELIEMKADKQPIGKYAALNPFTTHTISLEENDTIYIFTDGYQDQFGGDKGKKFKASQLKQLLITITNKPIEQQKQILAHNFMEWKNNHEQVDDVCIIGVKI